MSTINLNSGHFSWPLFLKTTEMQKKISPLSRWLILFATLILPIAYFAPIWSIKLWAPQYPEGLQMQIWINKLTGDISTINGLNHYIGMANIEESMFPELNFLQYILGAIIFLGVLTFVVNRPFLMKLFTITLVLLAVAAMVDMYIWGYKYGHNLDPHAAIKIEGESYQPPLIGYKQLLNFLALSIPDKGGYALFASGLIAVLASLIHWRKGKKKIATSAALGLIGLGIFYSCSSAPEKLNFNKDDCDYCGMKLVDDRFGAMAINDKGKAFRFDDVNCMLNFITENPDTKIEQKLIIDFSQPGTLIDATKAYYLKNEELKSPMGGNAAAFAKQDSLDKYHSTLNGEKTNWETIQRNE
ncbi:MAG: hypothetical protein K0S12_1977 [Bacteroidetes bacterium]|jgi:copper chaperone NosL|nr:hypothetical protein [Bacteroidota bacterium]